MTAVAAASTVALVVGVASLERDTTGAPAPVGDVPLLVAASGDDGTTEAPLPSPADAVGTRSARLEDLPAPAAPPVRVEVGEIGIDAPVVEIGVEPDSGAVAVPDDVSVAGWYRFGPVPGADGSAVLTAHVDSAEQGPGAFFPLRDAEPGSEVVVTSADGERRRFQVAGRASYPKSALPVEVLFARTGDPVLTLITCGGAFDAATRSYEENLVVYATPVDAGSSAG